MTPYERRARAQKIIQARENRSLYNNYLKEKESYEKQLEEERLKTVWTERDKNSQSFFVRGLHTVGDLVANVITGAVKGLEGIADLGIGLVGGIGGIFDGDFQERAKNAIAYDWTGETFGNALQEALKYSYTTNGGIIENVASGIGQMLPSVVVSVATAGAGAPAAAAQAASLATLGVSAAGTSTEEAFKEGADYWAGLGYGVASGLVEVGTEKMFGGATKALTGAGILDGVTRSVADTGIKRIAKNALEEGFEEIVSELANPALKSIYKGSEAFNDYGSLDYWKGVGEAGLVGSLTALAYSGTVGYGLSKVGVGYVGKEADIADSLSEIATLKEKANNLQANGELIGVNEQKIADTTKKNYQNIEKVLQGVSEDKRSKLIEKFNLDKAFNTDGSMSGQLSLWFNSVEESAEVSDGSQNELASLKKDSYSFNLRGQEQTIASDLDAISENLANKYMAAEQEKGNNITIEQAREQVGKVKVFDGEMSDNAKQSRNKFNKALNYLNKESGANLSFVVTESNDAFNGLVIDDRTMYIGEDQFEKGTWAETLVHEYTHLSEGSEEYAKLVDFLSSDNVLVDDGNGGKVELWKKGQESVFDKNYGFDRATIQEIHDKIANDQELTADEQKYFKDFMSEVGAHETEYLLGNEEFIDRIVARDSSFAKKFLQKIENLRKAFERVGDKEARKAYKQIHEAEKLYLKAAAKAGDMKLVRFILSRNPDLEKEIDVSAEIKYNKKTPYIQWKSDALAWSNNAKTKIGDMDSGSDSRYVYFYEAIDPDNDGRATDYRVLAKVSLANETTINEWYAEVKENNEKNHASVYASVDEYERARKEYQSDSSNVLGKTAENGRVSGVYQGESQSERIGNTEKGDGNKRVKYSLKDNEYLSAVKNGDLKTAQRFVDEAARKSGYTIKAYHGTLAENFTEFKKSFIGSRFSFDEKGFFFIDRKSIAEDYARSEFDSSKKGHVLETYLKVDKPLLVDSQYAFKEGLGKIFRDNDAIGVWDNYSDFLLEEADKKGADGIIIDDGLSKMIVVFDSNQIKSSETVTYDDKGNVIPLSERFNNQQNDIRYSLKEDSEGKRLSEGQREFFKDSKVVDEQGRLLVVYHGSKSIFTVFDTGRIGLNGSQEGQGIYFTDNKDFAEGYSDGKGQLLKGYLNIQKPLSDSEVTLTRKEVEQIIRKVDPSGDDLLANYSYDSRYYGTDKHGLWYESALKTTLDSVMGYSETDSEIMAELANAGAGSAQVLKILFDEFGYDGYIVKGKYKDTNVYVAFDSSQFKNVTNIAPTTDKDIRFDLKEDDLSKKYRYELSDGQIKKLIADKTMRKVYSKVESEKIINTILSESLGVGEKYGSLTGRAKSEVIEMLWRGLNTAELGKQMKVALDVAEYIIQNSVLENLYEDSENSIYIDTINALKPYLHSLDLSALKGEIKYKFDNDNSAYLLWGKRKGEKGLTADQIKKELDERGFFIDSDNEADIFFRMDSAYREAVAAMKKKTKELLSSALSAEERKTLKNNIAREVLIAFDKNGKQSTFSKILEQYHKEALTWKEKYYDERTRNTVINRLLDKVQKVKDWKSGTFLNASQYKTDIFKRSIDKLANIKFRGDLNQSGTREIVSDLKEWYSKSNPLLEGVYDSEIAEMLDDIATSEGKLSTQELRNLSNVVDYFKHFVETYNKVYRNGKYVEAQPIAEKYVSVIKRNQSVKVGWLKKYFEKYLTTFGDPMTVARYFDKYESGFYSEMLATLRESATKAQIDEMNIREPIEEFIKKNKKYFNEAEKKTVKYQGRDIPLLQAMYVYMAMNDIDTIPSFAKSGFVFNDGNSDVRIDGFAANEDVEIAEMQIMAKEIQTSLEKQFSAADKEYIEIARKIFNEDCRKRFSETSIILKGYTNAKEGDYVPIRRANIAKNVDTSTFEYEVNRASNASFTKDRVKGAKGELRVDGIDTVLDRHIRAVAQYANLAPAIEEYNKLFSLNTGEDNNKPVSVSTESRNLWAKGDEYFKKLISDIQGIPATKGDGIKFMAFIRGGYAKFQLGANPKVWVTQLSSFFAAGSILDYSSIVKGIGIKAGDVDTYCELAKLRNNDNTVAMAQGVLDKIDKVGNVLMKPIGTVDRFVITKLFGACQVQVQKDYGLKIGTEENKVKAGELLKRVILETQQNSMATERSSAMRSGSEFMRTITMFSADSMKVIGRVVDSIGELSALKAKKKILTDANEIANIDKQIKQATKKVAKSTASLITSAVFMALVAQLFRTLYNKDDEEDNVVANMVTDAIGNLFGGLPIFKDIYSRLVEGYDIDGYAYSAINDMLDSADNIFKTCGDIVSGEVTSQEVAKNIKNMVYAAGQIFGLPARNVYNVAYGLTKRVSPSAAYKIDTAFYNKNYTSDLNKAIARGDDDMIATIVELMTDERVGDIGDSAVSKELNSLVTKGFDVIPRSVGKKITYNGEEINLTNNQRKRFKEVYSVANKAVASLVKLNQYDSASEEVKAKAIKYIYSVYYNLALQDLLGVDLETKTVLFAEAIYVEKLAIIVATANSLTADLDNKGKAISGTRKRKIQSYVNSLRLSAAQKYMIMGYLGFRNLKGETQVKAYINRLNLTKSEKTKLLKYSGYGE